MLFGINAPFVPRNGHTLVVGIVARISGCTNQKEVSLEDQADHCKEYMRMPYPQGEIEFHVIATKGKGEKLNRPELAQLEKLLRSRVLDVLIVEELGRLSRGAEAHRLCGIAVNHKTRVLAPADRIDTIDPTWEAAALKASTSHVEFNILASIRIKQKTMNRFDKFGFTAARPVLGYIVPEGALSFDQWVKDIELADLIEEGAKFLRRTLNKTATADWFNDNLVPVGQMARRKKWDSAMLGRYYENPILIGEPWRGRMHSVKNYETGDRRSQKNPDGPHHYHAQHLAFLEKPFFYELKDALRHKNAGCGHPKINGVDSLTGRSRKRSHFPGQHSRCFYCGRQYLWGGNGITGNLMCGGSREFRCWNSVGFDGAFAARRISEEILSVVDSLAGFDAQFAAMVSEAQNSGPDLSLRWAELRRREQKFVSEQENLKKALREIGARPMIVQQLDELEEEEKNLRYERDRLESVAARRLAVPGSISELGSQLRSEFARLATSSFEFGDLLRLLVPEVHVYLVQLLDGGSPLPRARIKLNPCGDFPDHTLVPGLRELVTVERTIDLFDHLPKREAFRAQVVSHANANTGATLKDIARMTTPQTMPPTVKAALKLHQQILASEADSPFINLSDPPENFPKMRRHKSVKYRFDPLPGYPLAFS